MKKRNFAKLSVYTIAILSATLINQYIIDLIEEHIEVKGYTLVFIDMLIVVCVFSPAFNIVSKYTKKISTAYFRTSKSLSSNYIGVLIGVAAALFFLFTLFALRRHNIDVIQDLGYLVVSNK